MNRRKNLSARTSFTRRRGRFTIRINQGDWDFNPGVHNDQILPFDACRSKHMPAVSDGGIDQNHYKIKPEGPCCCARQRSRQILDDETPLCDIPSRRRSPDIREGPRRCIREPASELVGLRHGETFTRTFEDETLDPIYAHPQPPFEVDRRPFIQDQRNFPIQRKSFPRVDTPSWPMVSIQKKVRQVFWTFRNGSSKSDRLRDEIS